MVVVTVDDGRSGGGGGVMLLLVNRKNDVVYYLSYMKMYLDVFRGVLDQLGEQETNDLPKLLPGLEVWKSQELRLLSTRLEVRLLDK